MLCHAVRCELDLFRVWGGRPKTLDKFRVTAGRLFSARAKDSMGQYGDTRIGNKIAKTLADWGTPPSHRVSTADPEGCLRCCGANLACWWFKLVGRNAISKVAAPAYSYCSAALLASITTKRRVFLRRFSARRRGATARGTLHAATVQDLYWVVCWRRYSLRFITMVWSRLISCNCRGYRSTAENQLFSRLSSWRAGPSLPDSR